ncbi:flagellar protein FliT [Burkholderia gladioli]|nr:flagellar protein FliT [Burkholderia gladioli]MBU9158591.1 flagellar protein FliT [Burkholderia gladioli]MBU9199425.1 flagellar protein FliT [Burkholderia gladioli]MBU9427071.1 flagellar protein FliT [Burkholderia gladioli]MDR8088653.1 flagellar protein FliT [Burkholderia gladioli]
MRRSDMDQTTLVRQVLAMTHEIDRAVQLADWEGAGRLVAAREPYLTSIQAQQSPEAMLMIREIQAIDAATMAASSHARDELQHEYRAAMGRLDSARQYNSQAALRY